MTVLPGNLRRPRWRAAAASQRWATPEAVFGELHRRFRFSFDPCPDPARPLHPDVENLAGDGLREPWRGRVWLNPPYNRTGAWMRKALDEHRQRGLTIVALVPSRTGTRWWHDSAMQAAEIRFLRGRLEFTNCQTGQTGRAPFDSAIVIFRRRGRR